MVTQTDNGTTLRQGDRMLYGAILRRLAEEPFDLDDGRRIASLWSLLKEDSWLKTSWSTKYRGPSCPGHTSAGQVEIPENDVSTRSSVGRHQRERIGHYVVWRDENVIYWEHFMADTEDPPQTYHFMILDRRNSDLRVFGHMVPRMFNISFGRNGLLFWFCRPLVTWRRAKEDRAWLPPQIGMSFRLGI